MNLISRVFLLLAFTGFVGTASAEEEVRVITPDSIEYKSDANVPGVSFAVLSGNPKQGAYTVRVKIAPNVRLAPHYHPDARTVTVIAGTYYFAVGENFDESTLHGYGAGTVILVPAGRPHFAATRDDGTSVQESGPGPTAHIPAKR